MPVYDIININYEKVKVSIYIRFMPNLKSVQFKNAQGEMLSARIDFPESQKVEAYALFAHCFTCNKSLGAIRNISKALNQKGIAVMRFDFTGLGSSQGDFSETNFSSNISDLVFAAEFLTQSYSAPQIIIGHSLGGAASIFATSQIKSIKVVATIGAPSKPTHVQHLVANKMTEIQEKGVAEVIIGERPFHIKKQFIEDLQTKNMSEVLHQLRKPLLIMHAPFDEVVGIDSAAEIFKAALHPKSFISLDKANHLMSNPVDSIYVGNTIAAWASRYINLKTVDETKPDSENVAAVINDEPGYTVDLYAKNHHWLADEPKNLGGNDLGPNPYDLLASALGACTSMTLKMYAQRKKWNLTKVITDVKFSKIHQQDSEGYEQKDSLIQHFDVNIHIKGDLDEAQRNRLLEIAHKCPVHKSLKGDIQIEAHLSETVR